MAVCSMPVKMAGLRHAGTISFTTQIGYNLLLVEANDAPINKSMEKFKLTFNKQVYCQQRMQKQVLLVLFCMPGENNLKFGSSLKLELFETYVGLVQVLERV